MNCINRLNRDIFVYNFIDSFTQNIYESPRGLVTHRQWWDDVSKCSSDMTRSSVKTHVCIIEVEFYSAKKSKLMTYNSRVLWRYWDLLWRHSTRENAHVGTGGYYNYRKGVCLCLEWIKILLLRNKFWIYLYEWSRGQPSSIHISPRAEGETILYSLCNMIRLFYEKLIMSFLRERSFSL